MLYAYTTDNQSKLRTRNSLPCATQRQWHSKLHRNREVGAVCSWLCSENQDFDNEISKGQNSYPAPKSVASRGTGLAYKSTTKFPSVTIE